MDLVAYLIGVGFVSASLRGCLQEFLSCHPCHSLFAVSHQLVRVESLLCMIRCSFVHRDHYSWFLSLWCWYRLSRTDATCIWLPLHDFVKMVSALHVFSTYFGCEGFHTDNSCSMFLQPTFRMPTSQVLALLKLKALLRVVPSGNPALTMWKGGTERFQVRDSQWQLVEHLP